MPGALSPYTVLEMGDHPSVAVLGMLLADQGANVTKIEPTTGDPLRGTPVFSVWNRGKQSVMADPGAEDGAERVKALLAGADVVIESFYSGANPFDIDRSSQRTIHVTLPGFGSDHPDHDVRGSELVVSSATGVYVDRSPDSTEGASFIALPYASVFAAMVAAPAIAAALFHREKDRRSPERRRTHLQLNVHRDGNHHRQQAGHPRRTCASVPSYRPVLPLRGWTLDQPERELRTLAEAPPRGHGTPRMVRPSDRRPPSPERRGA